MTREWHEQKSFHDCLFVFYQLVARIGLCRIWRVVKNPDKRKPVGPVTWAECNEAQGGDEWAG
jgi:hypothetical protein